MPVSFPNSLAHYAANRNLSCKYYALGYLDTNLAFAQNLLFPLASPVKAGFEVTKVVDRFILFSTDSKLPQHPLLVKTYLRTPLLGGFFGGLSHPGNGLQGGL